MKAPDSREHSNAAISARTHARVPEIFVNQSKLSENCHMKTPSHLGNQSAYRDKTKTWKQRVLKGYRTRTTASPRSQRSQSYGQKTRVFCVLLNVILYICQYTSYIKSDWGTFKQSIDAHQVSPRKIPRSTQNKREIRSKKRNWCWALHMFLFICHW